jgi:hypothetical protein
LRSPETPLILSLSKTPLILSLSKTALILSLSKAALILSLSKAALILSLSKDERTVRVAMLPSARPEPVDGRAARSSFDTLRMSDEDER